MIILKSNISKDFKALKLLLCLIICANSFLAFSQTASSNTASDPYYMTIEPAANKPKLQYFQVRLKGDHGVSLIDIKGNIIVRNFAPVTNSYGEVDGTNYTSPVIDDIFSVVRYKKTGPDWNDYRRSITIYSNASSPTPIPGLTDLYSANIINPNLFPISRYGERIKFVDKNGKEKFTVMPIDGKEPDNVYPCSNWLIIVQVDNDKYGAINTQGKWVIYPEWNEITGLHDGSILGLKDNGAIYKITLTDKFSESTRLDTPIDFYGIGLSNGKYLVEEFFDNTTRVANIYDLNYKYITTINNADFIRPNLHHLDLILVRKNFKSSQNAGFQCIIDVGKNNVTVSKHYAHMKELPDGNYLAYNEISESDIHKCWFVKADGSEITLPVNTEFPLMHPQMALLYNGTVENFIVKPTAEKSGYICDNHGVKVGNLEIEDYYHWRWQGEPVNSSYYRINILDKKNN